jgi:hypothetical protein
MRFIPTRIHGFLDYLMAVLLIASPWLFGFADQRVAQWIPIILGVGIIVYSLITRYELGVAGVISMRTHLWLDAAGGFLLAVSPWLFGFAELVWLPHLILGLLEIGAAATTKTRPDPERTPRARTPQLDR